MGPNVNAGDAAVHAMPQPAPKAEVRASTPGAQGRALGEAGAATVRGGSSVEIRRLRCLFFSLGSCPYLLLLRSTYCSLLSAKQLLLHLPVTMRIDAARIGLPTVTSWQAASTLAGLMLVPYQANLLCVRSRSDFFKVFCCFLLDVPLVILVFHDVVQKAIMYFALAHP